jgi:hypothetical protein
MSHDGELAEVVFLAIWIERSPPPLQGSAQGRMRHHSEQPRQSILQDSIVGFGQPEHAFRLVMLTED